MQVKRLDGWTCADCRGRGRIRRWEGLPRQRPYSALRRLDIRKRYAAKVRFGPGAATAPPRPCNRRLASVIRRPGPRSAIVGHYSASKGVCELRNKQALVVCVLLSYAVSRPLPPSRPFRGCPLPPEAIPRSPLALALPACVRPVALPPTGQYYPAQSPEVGAAPAPAGESGADPQGAPGPHCQGQPCSVSTRKS